MMKKMDLTFGSLLTVVFNYILVSNSLSLTAKVFIYSTVQLWEFKQSSFPLTQVHYPTDWLGQCFGKFSGVKSVE